MRNSSFFSVSLMLGLLLASLPAHPQDPKLLSLLQGKNKQIDDAIIKGDLAPVIDLFSPAVTITNPVGGFVGREEFVQNIKSGTLKYTLIQPTDEKLAQFGNVAVLTFLTTEAGTMQGHDISGKFRYTEVWATDAGKWRIVAVQLTPVIPENK